MEIIKAKLSEVSPISEELQMRVQTLQDLLLLAIEGQVDGHAYETLRIMRWNLKYVRGKL